MHVRLERPAQPQPELLDERRIPPRLLEHRIDEDRLPAVGQEVGVRGGLLVEKLPEDHAQPYCRIPPAVSPRDSGR
jgi:hypothetical protein